MKKIVLLCANGMSTGMLVNKMRAVAEKNHYECSIDAYGISTADTNAKDADCILLGPQVGYEIDDIKEKFPNIPSLVIDTVAYGRLDGLKVLRAAKELMEGK